MRRLTLAVLTAAMLLTLVSPAAAHPRSDLAPTLPTDLTHARTTNIDYLGRFPEHVGTAGGTPSADGKLFYLTDPRGVYIYDTANPASPTLLGKVSLYQQTTGVALGQEDPDTDGRILLVDGATAPVGTSALQVVDVSTPSAPKIISSVAVTDHTWECVSGIDATGVQRGCAYAYGRTGHIIDLRDPAKPVKLSTSWKTVAKYTGYTHDLNEIRPGLTMSAGAENILLDTSDPARPIKLTTINKALHGHAFASLGYHSVEWPNAGTDKFLIAGTEISPPPANGGMGAGSDCTGTESVIETWDTTEILAGLADYAAGIPAAEAFAGRAFRKVDAFDAAGRGIFLQGGSPANQLYCAHWMEANPLFTNGGMIAVSYYDRGTRFVEVDTLGKMTEKGWVTAAEGHSGSVQWVSSDVAYIMDYRRGMEVVRFRQTPPTGVVSDSSAAIAMGSSYVPASTLSLEQLPLLGAGLMGLGLVRIHRRSRRNAA